MPMKSITKIQYEKLKETIKKMKDELIALKAESPEEMWQKDLNDLKVSLKKEKLIWSITLCFIVLLFLFVQ